MALVPVRSKKPVNGEHITSTVDEAWLQRWPDDWERIEVDTAPAANTVDQYSAGDALDATVADDPASPAV